MSLTMSMPSLFLIDVYEHEQSHVFEPGQLHGICSDACRRLQIKYHSVDGPLYLGGQAMVLLLGSQKKGGRNAAKEWLGEVKR